MTERWKDIPGYEGLYQVSDMGKVKRIATGRGTFVDKILKSYPCIRGGYQQVMLLKDGLRKHKQIHHLVLDTFRGPRPIDGNPNNSKLINLEWGTRSENMKDAVKHGTHFAPGKYIAGSQHPMSKLTENDIVQIRQLYNNGQSATKIAKLFDVHHATIYRILNKQTWRHCDD